MDRAVFNVFLSIAMQNSRGKTVGIFFVHDQKYAKLLLTGRLSVYSRCRHPTERANTYPTERGTKLTLSKEISRT
jgi:hypothetical protein